MPSVKWSSRLQPAYHCSAKWDQLRTTHELQNFVKNTLILTSRHKIEIFAYCFMGNHFHLLVKDAGDLNKETQSTTSKQFQKWITELEDMTKAKVWIKKITSRPEFLACLRYIYANPLAAGLCKRAQDYPFSSLPEFLGASQNHLPTVANTEMLIDPLHCFLRPNQVLPWVEMEIQHLASN